MALLNRLLALAWGLNVYDAAITIYATQCHGVEELNPLMGLLLSRDPMLFAAIKLLLMTLMCLIMRRRFKEHPKKVWATLGCILGVYATVCVWNTVVVAVILKT